MELPFKFILINLIMVLTREIIQIKRKKYEITYLEKNIM